MLERITKTTGVTKGDYCMKCVKNYNGKPLALKIGCCEGFENRVL